MRLVYLSAPSVPSFIHFSELTTTSVNVSWGEPTFPNGIIEGYRLIYEPCTPVEGERSFFFNSLLAAWNSCNKMLQAQSKVFYDDQLFTEYDLFNFTCHNIVLCIFPKLCANHFSDSNSYTQQPCTCSTSINYIQLKCHKLRHIYLPLVTPLL